jgi:hypothetical protein
MRVRVVVTVEMDDEAVGDWRLAYGTEGGKREITRAVKEHIGNAAQQIAPFGTGEVNATITWE